MTTPNDQDDEGLDITTPIKTERVLGVEAPGVQAAQEHAKPSE